MPVELCRHHRHHRGCQNVTFREPTAMDEITDADRLRGSIGPQICEHLRSIVIIKKVTEKIKHL